MKILYIADNFPELGAGSSVRNFYLVKALAKNNTVDVVGLVDYRIKLTPTKIKNVTYVILERMPLSIFKKAMCVLKGSIPFIAQRKNMQLPKHIIEKINQYDLIHIAELNSFFIVENYLQEIKGKIVLDSHNVEYTKIAKELHKKSQPFPFLGEFFARSIRRLEINCIKKVDHVIVCSAVDQQWYEQYIAKERITVIPNGVDISYFKEKLTASKKNIVLFMGLLSYFPNEEGIKYYISQIHPLVKQKIGNVQLHIIGKNCPEWLKEASNTDKSITIFGFVPDQRPYIFEASVCIAPLLAGSGTRLKILEYMAAGKAVVATSRGAEGITVTHGTNILIGDTATSFATEIIDVLQHKNTARKLGIHAQTLMRESYDWEKIGKTLTATYILLTKVT